VISTSLAAVLVGLSAVATGPTWLTDYRAALARVSAEHKPVAVFIAPGANGYAKLVHEGQLGTDATLLLSQQYVALHIDPTTPAGQQTAQSFGMTEGLVISDRSGGIQAYRHVGPLSQAELTASLRVCAETTPAIVPVSTSTSHYPAAPAVSAPPTIVTPTSLFAPATSSCPTGRCPYAR
jgi:hypothetical protein